MVVLLQFKNYRMPTTLFRFFFMGTAGLSSTNWIPNTSLLIISAFTRTEIGLSNALASLWNLTELDPHHTGLNTKCAVVCVHTHWSCGSATHSPSLLVIFPRRDNSQPCLIYTALRSHSSILSTERQTDSRNRKTQVGWKGRCTPSAGASKPFG